MPEKTLEELYQKLEEYSHFEKDEENFLKFSDTADEIILKKNPSSIPILLQYIDDNCEYDYVQEHLCKALEYFETQDYISEIIKNLDIVWKKGRGYIVSIIGRILNVEADFPVLKKCMKNFSNIALLYELLDNLDLRAKKYDNKLQQSLISELRKELEKSQHDNEDASQP